MIPDERPQEGTSFPFLGPAVFALTLYAVVSVTLPPSPLRSAVAIAAFFAMGYAALALVAGGHIRLSSAEILAFTIGLTILLTSISALAVSIVGIPITEFAVIIIGLPLGVVTWLLRRPRLRPRDLFTDFTRRYLDFSDYTSGEKGVAAVLLLAVVGALVLFISMAAVQFPSDASPALAITGPDGTPATLPTSFVVGQPQVIGVTVLGGSRGGSYEIRVRLVPANATGSETFNRTTQASPLRLAPFTEYVEPITIGAGQTSSRSFTIVMEAPGDFELRFELLTGTGAVVAGSRLRVQVA